MSDEERKSEKKKKKKHKDPNRERKKKHRDEASKADSSTDALEAKIRAKQREERRNNKKRRDDDNEEEDDRKPAARPTTEAVDRLGSRSRAERHKSNEYDSKHSSSSKKSEKERRSQLERAKSERDKLQQQQEGEGDDTLPSDTNVYCPTVQADEEIMAEINQDGAVQVDDSGGIQAFVAETIEIDGDDVGIIKSDAEVELEEKRKYSKLFMGAVAAIVLGVIVIVVPLTLKFARGGTRLQLNIVTQQPTDVPSMMPSASPSSMPSSVRFMEITDKMYFLSGEKLYEQGTPQYLSAMWMADGDPLRLDPDDARFAQRYIMALFYYAMDGERWVEQNGWLSELSECYWYGVDGTSPGCGSPGAGGCIPRTDFKGSYDKVCRLDFGRLNNLYGEFPSELSYLNEMRFVNIQTDFLYGTIPDSLGTNWTKLEAFLVGDNFIGGGFPATFKDNTMLGTIFIDQNKFNGTFPEVFTTLKNLEWLDAENNEFEGSLPDALGNLKNLRILNLNNNSLTGYIPDTWDADNLIEDFELSDNNLKGPLPESLANTPFLKDLRLSRNALSGTIPVNYYNWEALEELYLDENKIGGELPQTQEPFYNGLQELSLHSNEFEGRFPIEWMENTFRIKVIELHRNQMTGTLSTSNICDRLDPGRSYTRLLNLTADCDKMTCDCCTACYINGELASGG